MASREKRPPLAPKTKQKINNDNTSLSATATAATAISTTTTTTAAAAEATPTSTTTTTTTPATTTTTPTTSKKGKSLPRYILEPVASSSKISLKLETRKKVIGKTKKNLRGNKNNSNNIIKVKNTKNVPVKNIKRLASASGGSGGKVVNKKINKTTLTKTKRITKKQKLIIEQQQQQQVPSDIDNNKTNPKTSLKLKLTLSPDSIISKKSTTTTKIGNNNRKLIDNNIVDIKYLKKQRGIKNTVDSTIDQVLAMVSDTENSDLTIDMDNNKPEGKITRSKKILIDDNKTILSEVEIKKELIEAEENDDGIDYQQQEIKLRTSQRRLRNNKLRQLDSSTIVDVELNKKNKRINLDDTIVDNVNSNHGDDDVDDAGDNNYLVDGGNFEFNERLGSNSSEIKNQDDDDVKIELKENEKIIEIENNNNINNNNSGVIDGGPNLRSKAKSKSTDLQLKLNDGLITIDNDKNKLNNYEQLKKEASSSSSSSSSKVSNDNVDDNIDDKDDNDNDKDDNDDDDGKQQVNKRRSSLNIDVKKTIGSLYGNEKNEGTNEKSQIDKMIENIKLTIAETIKTNSPFLVKNYDLNKTDDSNIILPLSCSGSGSGNSSSSSSSSSNSNSGSNKNSSNSNIDTQKSIINNNNNDDDDDVIVDEDDDEDEDEEDDDKNITNVSSIESTSNCSGENSVPKVADTAKEIEKLVMGDCQTTNLNDKKNDDDNDDNINSIDYYCESITKSDVKKTTGVLLDIADDFVSNKNNELSDDTELQLNCNDKIDNKNITPELLSSKTSENIDGDDDNETLESISAEIEKLVADTEPVVVVSPETSKVDDDKQDENQDIIKTAEEEEIIESSEIIKESNEKILVNEKEQEENNSKIDSCLTSHSEMSNELSTQEDEKIEDIKNVEQQEKQQQEEEQEVSVKVERSKSRLSDGTKVIEETRRVLRTRETRQKKTRSTEPIEVKNDSQDDDKIDKSIINDDDTTTTTTTKLDVIKTPETLVDVKIEIPDTDIEPQIRTRRGRDVKRRRDDTTPPSSSSSSTTNVQSIIRAKRNRRDTRKSEQNKEETLLDNEVAEINENKDKNIFINNEDEDDDDDDDRDDDDNNKYTTKKRLKGTESLGILTKNNDDKENSSKNNRSKSENDISCVLSKTNNDVSKTNDEKLQRCQSNDVVVNDNNNTKLDNDFSDDKNIENNNKSPNEIINNNKDSDGASTSGESSINIRDITETPEEKEKKEKVLRMLGLESLERAAERLNSQKIKREQYTGTLKTVIRVQKERDRDKKRSRSPLKMVLKQGRTDGEGDSPEFYTIQKELGSSSTSTSNTLVSGDNTSVANRKFSTNHRQSCDEDNEEEKPKERQSLIIPEKSSSFSIHPGRLCADVCCYCFGKFGSLDTPMHLAQQKSDERRKKILDIERHLTKDSCLCDACYRHIDRRANMSPTNIGAKIPRQHRQLMMTKCCVKDCKITGRNLIKRRWLMKIKSCLQKSYSLEITFDWDPHQHTSMIFCPHHYDAIARFFFCFLCKCRLNRNTISILYPNEIAELNQSLPQLTLTGGPVLCKTCRQYTTLIVKFKDNMETMNPNSRSFFINHRKQLLQQNDIVINDNNNDEDESTTLQNSLIKEKRSNKKVKLNTKSATSKSPEISPLPPPLPMIDDKSTAAAISPTVTPKKIDELINKDESTKETSSSNETDKINKQQQQHHVLDLESTVEKLKKRKALDQHLYSTESPIFDNNCSNDILEILAMDKEVTLTRLPKKPRLNNNSNDNDNLNINNNNNNSNNNNNNNNSNNDITPVVQRLGANPSISVRTLFPGEEEMGLHANIEFNNIREVTPHGWEKCATVIQYDHDTKLLWQELQRPYGNQSSFLRHLILLEKYYRAGDLLLAPNASRNAINYSTSVQNRLISYEGPEKIDEPIVEPIPTDYSTTNPRRLSGGYWIERDRYSMPSTSSFMSTSGGSCATSTPSIKSSILAQQQQQQQNNAAKLSATSRILKMSPGVSIIKKPPLNLQRITLSGLSATTLTPTTSTAASAANGGSSKRKEAFPTKVTNTFGGKVFQLSEPAFKRLQTLKKQKMLNEKMESIITTTTSAETTTTATATAATTTTVVSTGTTTSTTTTTTGVNKNTLQYQKAHLIAQTQFQKHLQMQQEMLGQQRRGDFEPLICDVRTLINENTTPTQNLINNLNLPKSIQVTAKPSSNPIPILPKMPKSLTVIPQSVPRTVEKN